MSDPHDDLLHSIASIVDNLSDSAVEDVLYDDISDFDTNTEWIEALGEVMDEEGLT
jgi:hypothetical protein